MAKILILDDDYELSATWRDALSAQGHQVELAMSSSEAIAYEGAAEFDLFIVDLVFKIDLPDMADSGASFLGHLARKHSGLLRAPPVIGVSGFRPSGGTSPVESFFRAYRVSKVLLKPFDPAELSEAVGRLLQQDDRIKA